MEQWLQERQAYAEGLQKRAERTGSLDDMLLWERYVRKTARMQTTAEGLRGALPPSFSVAHGLRLRSRGKEVYLEHLVVGPTGIFLVENREDDSEWTLDLARSIDFFRQSLGVHAALFTCLVITRECVSEERLPEGAIMLESLETAISVIQDNRAGQNLSPVVAQEIWQLVEALRLSGSAPVVRKRSVGWIRPETISLLLALAMSVYYDVNSGDLSGSMVFATVVFFFMPVAGVMGLIQLIPREGWRKGVAYTFLVLEVLFFLLLLLGLNSEPS